MNNYLGYEKTKEGLMIDFHSRIENNEDISI